MGGAMTSSSPNSARRSVCWFCMIREPSWCNVDCASSWIRINACLKLWTRTRSCPFCSLRVLKRPSIFFQRLLVGFFNVVTHIGTTSFGMALAGAGAGCRVPLAGAGPQASPRGRGFFDLSRDSAAQEEEDDKNEYVRT